MLISSEKCRSTHKPSLSEQMVVLSLQRDLSRFPDAMRLADA
jgi:hypothetical protein